MFDILFAVSEAPRWFW